MRNIPVITISEKTLAQAFEAALLALYKNGTRFRTQYDKPDDPMMDGYLSPSSQL